jgi:hypothetical protein
LEDFATTALEQQGKRQPLLFARKASQVRAQSAGEMPTVHTSVPSGAIARSGMVTQSGEAA